MRTLHFTLPLLALLAACPMDAPQQYLVPDLRIVAIKASAGGGPSADADITETVTLEPLVINPLNRTGVTLEWFGCLPAIPPDRAPCEDPQVLRDPQALRDLAALGSVTGPFPITGTPVTLDLTPAQEAILDGATSFLVAAATTTPRLQCQLYFSLPIAAIVSDDSGEVTEVALTYVRIAPSAAQAAFPDAYVLNMNPVLDPSDPLDPFEPLLLNPTNADACNGGAPLVDSLSLPAGAVSTVCGRTETPPQAFNLCEDSGVPAAPNAVEELSWQWYLSTGEIAQAGFDGNVIANPIDLTPSVGAFTLWTIVRDGRGGTAWAVRSLTGL